MNAVTPASRWHARLELDFARHFDKTIIRRRDHRGPLVIQKPFYPEADTCHVYLIHPPGGVVGGDKLDLEVTLDNRAHALLTTPAANKFYRSAGARADVTQAFRVAEGAVLEWLPQENIFFSDSRVSLQTRIELAADTKLMTWEMNCLGRPASGENFGQGRLRQGLELWQNGKPLFIDRSTIQGGDAIEQAEWGLAGYTVVGTFVVFPATLAMLEHVRQDMAKPGDGVRFSVSLMGHVLVCRCLSQQAEAMREIFSRVWTRLRPALIDKPACIPRIWNT